ncbi:UPF0104 family protein [Methanobrevibacter sp. OttesenSCG-928-K11]|nr:UPF0104 family protein [Methanobrevibacter sp. OttesenSCG-928-K11]MDL2270828.1 UPF0104 family protein [Methanobrevibacter sp. OttesenSCG-928-I08]
MSIKTVLFLIVGVVIMAVMLWFIGIEEIIASLELANLWLILAAIAIQVFTYFLYAFRWEIINKITDIDVGFKKLLPMVLVGLAVNNITPSGRGGGEPVRAYILAKEVDKPMEESFATVITDRALDTFPFVLLAVITIIGVTFYFPLSPWIVGVMILAVVAIILVLSLLIYMSINENFGKKLTNWIIRIVHRFYKKDPENMEIKVKEIVGGFQSTMKQMISNKNMLYYALPLSFIIWIFEILRVYVVFLAFGVSVSPIIIGEIFILASLIGMIPLLPGGLGAIDGVMILFYSAAGIPASISAAATVVERLISFWMSTIIGLLLVPHYGASVLNKISSIGDRKETPEEDIIEELEYISHKNDNEK